MSVRCGCLGISGHELFSELSHVEKFKSLCACGFERAADGVDPRDLRGVFLYFRCSSGVIGSSAGPPGQRATVPLPQASPLLVGMWEAVVCCHAADSTPARSQRQVHLTLYRLVLRFSGLQLSLKAYHGAKNQFRREEVRFVIEVINGKPRKNAQINAKRTGM